MADVRANMAAVTNSHLDKSAHSVVDGDKVNISNKTNMADIFTKIPKSTLPS